MVGHRKAGQPRTRRDKIAVPAGWFIVLSVVACVGSAGWLGVMLVGPSAATAEGSSSSAPTASAPAPSTATPDAVETTVAPDPTPSPTEAPVEREASVSVLNNTGIVNLAKGFSGQVVAAGWTVSGRGNWRGEIEANTVYYPDGLKDQAQLLASDVGIDRVLPSIVPMRMDRLTIILSGPQQ